MKSPVNGKPIYINERLPTKDKEVHMYANKQLNLRTTTNNCAVKVEIQNEVGMKSFVEVKSKKEVDKLASRATKKDGINRPSSSKREREVTPSKSWIQEIKNCENEEEMMRICKNLVAGASPSEKTRLTCDDL